MAILNRLGTLLIRARYILRDEGFISFMRSVCAFLLYLASNLYIHRSLYLYQHTVKERNEADFLPRVTNITCKVISTNDQADDLVRQGFDDFRQQVPEFQSHVDKGAIAFCFFVGREFAHIGWVALTEEAKSQVDSYPYHVNFADRQACTGGTLTILKYRGKGLMAYGYFKRLEFLREHGITTSRNAVDIRNTTSQKAHAKLGPIVYARAYYTKILWWKFWKEVPILPVTLTQ